MRATKRGLPCLVMATLERSICFESLSSSRYHAATRERESVRACVREREGYRTIWSERHTNKNGGYTRVHSSPIVGLEARANGRDVLLELVGTLLLLATHDALVLVVIVVVGRAALEEARLLRLLLLSLVVVVIRARIRLRVIVVILIIIISRSPESRHGGERASVCVGACRYVRERSESERV